MSEDSQFVIRPATLADEPYLLSMMRQLVEQEPNQGVFRETLVCKTLHYLFNHPERGRIWTLAFSAKPVGYMVLTLGFSFEFHGTDAFIDELYIAPAFRRRGFGMRAVEHLETEAKMLGVNALHLEVDRGNDAAFGLYRRTGFKDHNRFLMTKWLQQPE
ncbi:MAG: GNAT family N-acetyltransferase [Acidobacteria bacterium]|nr:GNAT family N-acetyltransferase [Acidobacteriota bacterium]MBS1865321.1 GNAT family N-acetyltransferase [Acidobacteriota bacterium]